MSDDKSEIEKIREKKMDEMMGSEEAQDEQTESTPNEPVHIGSASELNETVEKYGVVLTDFYADWCGPCKMLEPIVKEIAAETDGVVAKVDIDEQPRLAQQYNVRGVPTLVLFSDGNPVETFVGVQDKETLSSMVESYS